MQITSRSTKTATLDPAEHFIITYTKPVWSRKDERAVDQTTTLQVRSAYWYDEDGGTVFVRLQGVRCTKAGKPGARTDSVNPVRFPEAWKQVPDRIRTVLQRAGMLPAVLEK